MVCFPLQYNHMSFVLFSVYARGVSFLLAMILSRSNPRIPLKVLIWWVHLFVIRRCGCAYLYWISLLKRLAFAVTRSSSSAMFLSGCRCFCAVIFLLEYMFGQILLHLLVFPICLSPHIVLSEINHPGYLS